MLTHHYIETVFESLEAALEHGIIDDWSVKGANFVVHHTDEVVTVSQRKAADYVSEMLRRHVETVETCPEAQEAARPTAETAPPTAQTARPTAQTVRSTAEIARPAMETGHWLRLAIS